MSDQKPERLFAVVSPREARLLFWLVLIALLAIIANLSAGVVETLSGPAVILFVAWLMAYVLEPFVDWLARHMPFKSRGLAVAVTYVTTIVIAFVVLLAAGVTLIQAAISFAENLPAIVARVRELLTPMGRVARPERARATSTSRRSSASSSPATVRPSPTRRRPLRRT